MTARANQAEIESPRGARIGVNEEFAGRFRRRFRLDYERVIGRMISEAELVPGDRVLDVTAEEASLALRMASRIAPGQVVGVCPAEEILGQAYRQAQAAGLEESIDWRITPMEDLPFPSESFDAVTCSLAFRFMDVKTFIAEAYRLLVPGGRLLITEALVPPSGFNQWRLTLRGLYHQHITRNQAEAEAEFCSADELADLMHNAGFEPIVIRGLQKPLTRHSWVFSLIKARKP
jgi:ubiquinone/menaquinone biosynthesis C-methylase UbiE